MDSQGIYKIKEKNSVKAWYSATVDKFLRDSAPAVDGTSKVWTELNDHSAQYLLTYQQKDAWKKEISIVRSMLVGKESDGRVILNMSFLGLVDVLTSFCC